jgi:hypothetical protein
VPGCFVRVCFWRLGCYAFDLLLGFTAVLLSRLTFEDAFPTSRRLVLIRPICASRTNLEIAMVWHGDLDLVKPARVPRAAESSGRNQRLRRSRSWNARPIHRCLYCRANPQPSKHKKAARPFIGVAGFLISALPFLGTLRPHRVRRTYSGRKRLSKSRREDRNKLCIKGLRSRQPAGGRISCCANNSNSFNLSGPFTCGHVNLRS